MDTEQEASVAMHQLATHHLPMFVTAPGEPDWLLNAMGIFLVLAVVGIGVFYLKLHALPEHMAHRGQKLQYEIVAALALISLFTHNHIFWIAGLLLAMVPLPDFTTPLTSMARSLGKMAGIEPQSAQDDLYNEPPAPAAEPSDTRSA